jgi:hypothetical protein
MSVPIAIALTVAWTTLPALAPATMPSPATILTLPVAFTDMSGEVSDQTNAHQHRLELMTAELAATLPRQTGVSAVSLTQAQFDSACPKSDSECILALARQRGAARILIAEVFKTSTLILNLRARMIDVATNRQVAARFISFRGDTDASWQQAARFLAQQMRDQEPAPSPAQAPAER